MTVSKESLDLVPTKELIDAIGRRCDSMVVALHLRTTDNQEQVVVRGKGSRVTGLGLVEAARMRVQAGFLYASMGEMT